jgi:MoxR-like ATPase
MRQRRDEWGTILVELASEIGKRLGWTSCRIKWNRRREFRPRTRSLRRAALTLLCGGHALVEGVPGVAKTLAVKTLARFLALSFQRVQGTPDMMPADMLGTNVFSPQTNSFALHKGPVFTQFLLADEINRMPPRTQAGLLECMEERQVTMDGEAHVLDDFFTVFATQNPVDSKAPTRCPRRSSTGSC